MDAAAIKAAFPEFAATADPRVTFWLNVAAKRLTSPRWVEAELLDEGTQLFVAHHLALEAKGADAVAPLASQSVDKVAMAFDNNAASLENAGQWALTSYGVQYLQLARLVGAGGIQLYG